jgi:hypothetical protein
MKVHVICKNKKQKEMEEASYTDEKDLEVFVQKDVADISRVVAGKSRSMVRALSHRK